MHAVKHNTIQRNAQGGTRRAEGDAREGTNGRLLLVVGERTRRDEKGQWHDTKADSYTTVRKRREGRASAEGG